MSDAGRDILIGVDAGTSVIKCVAFDLCGRQLAAAATANQYTTRADGAAVQPLARTWTDCATTLQALAGRVPDLARRAAAVAVTGQGDGTWLIGAGNEPAAEAWLWLDSRSAPTVRRLRAAASESGRFTTTGTGLNACQQGAQLAHLDATEPAVLDSSEKALHCKDWLYLNLTGIRATDPSEANFTYGDFRSRRYDDGVIEALGLSSRRALLPDIVDGTTTTHPLTDGAAAATGLLAGTPVALGYVDVVCTAIGAGVYSENASPGCSIIGSTGMHMRAVRDDAVQLNEAGTGYVMVLPLPGMVAQIQSNMAATINLDWIVKFAGDLVADVGGAVEDARLVENIERWVLASEPGTLLYHPYISEAGERGPFVNNAARAGFNGLTRRHRYPDLLRAVMEGLGFAARHCYAMMGPIPPEVRLTGGAARSPALRGILAAVLNAAVRTSSRAEAGAAGAAMIAAVGIGVHDTMQGCIAEWVTPLLGEIEPPDPALAELYARLYPAYALGPQALEPVWDILGSSRAATHG